MTATTMRTGTRWVSANDTVSRVALSGAGDALLVLIHEMSGTLESWDLVVEPLGRRRRVLRNPQRDWSAEQDRGTRHRGRRCDRAAIRGGFRRKHRRRDSDLAHDR